MIPAGKSVPGKIKEYKVNDLERVFVRHSSFLKSQKYLEILIDKYKVLTDFVTFICD